MYDPHHLLRVTMQSIRDAVVTTDETARVQMLNPAAESMTGWASAEAIGRPVEDVLDLRNGDFREDSTDTSLLNPAYIVLRDNLHIERAEKSWLIGQNGRRIAVQISASPINDLEGRLQGAVLILHDISEAIQLADRIAYRAHHDPLTGLPNRILLADRIQQATRLADRNSDQLAVFFLDIDQVHHADSRSAHESHHSAYHDFDHFRHTAGSALADQLLKEIAQRLTGSLRESDTVCRLGGKEFVLLLPGVKSSESIEALAAKLLIALTRTYALGEHHVQISAGLGISLYPRHARDVGTLIRLADEAARHLRKTGPNRYRFANAHPEPKPVPND